MKYNVKIHDLFLSGNPNIRPYFQSMLQFTNVTIYLCYNLPMLLFTNLFSLYIKIVRI